MRKRKSDSSDLGVLLLDVKQVAELLNIGVSTVWALVKVGRFPEPLGSLQDALGGGVWTLSLGRKR